MNENIKAMCLELAKLGLETKGIYIHVSNFCLLITNYEEKTINSIYYDNIFFTDEYAEERIKKALDYVKSLGGNKDV